MYRATLEPTDMACSQCSGVDKKQHGGAGDILQIRAISSIQKPTCKKSTESGQKILTDLFPGYIK